MNFNHLKIIHLNSRFREHMSAGGCPSGDAVWKEGINHISPNAIKILRFYIYIISMLYILRQMSNIYIYIHKYVDMHIYI